MRIALKALAGLAAVDAIQAHLHSSSCTSSSASRSAATADADAELFRDLSSAPTTIKRFRRLLVEGGALRTGEALEKLIVFDFNGPELANGAMGVPPELIPGLPVCRQKLPNRRKVLTWHTHTEHAHF
jgi:hypothetical protein